MKTMLKGLLLSCVLVAVTGCGVTGKWTMKSLSPESEKEHFNLQALCLMDDGTYMACAKEGEQCKCLKGTYQYDAKAKTLTFKTDSKERSYHAEVGCCGGQMKVTPAEKGEEWTALMKRVGSCPQDKCCPGGKMCDPKTCNPKMCPHAMGAPGKAPAEKSEKAETKKPAEAKKPVEAKKPAEGKKPAEAKPGETK